MIREVTVLYNLCNEPWLKYSMAAVADKGFKKSQWTSARLRRDTLYLETKDGRYQLSWVKGKGKEAERRLISIREVQTGVTFGRDAKERYSVTKRRVERRD